jgi:hypothetical protein
MSGWWLVLAAFAAMAVQDVVCVLMVRAETSGRPHRAAACDMLQDALGLSSLAAIGTAVVTSDALLSAAVIAARLAGDYAGTYTGVRFGVWLDKRRKGAPVEISWNCSPGADEQFITTLKRYIRPRGDGGAGVLK